VHNGVASRHDLIISTNMLMRGINNKDGDEPDLQELEEPKTLDVVIDGTAEKTRRQWVPYVLLAVSALAVVSIALGVLFGLAMKEYSLPVSPQAVSSPTQSPTSSAVNEFMNGLPSYSLELAENDISSPQAKALWWLQMDPQYNEYELYRLYQRYALAVLYYSTNGDSWSDNSGWLSDDNECLWYHQFDELATHNDISCTEASRLTALYLDKNGLDGTIPTELELLTDVENVRLYSSSSGKIHSEL
jgi:hypothetical protein